VILLPHPLRLVDYRRAPPRPALNASAKQLLEAADASRPPRRSRGRGRRGRGPLLHTAPPASPSPPPARRRPRNRLSPKPPPTPRALHSSPTHTHTHTHAPRLPRTGSPLPRRLARHGPEHTRPPARDPSAPERALTVTSGSATCAASRSPGRPGPGLALRAPSHPSSGPPARQLSALRSIQPLLFTALLFLARPSHAAHVAGTD
jgi:hypothetical protein